MTANEKIGLNVTDVAALLSVSRPTVYAMIRREIDPLPTVRLGEQGGRMIIPRDQLQTWLARQAEERA